MAVNLAHKCAAFENKSSKAVKVTDLEKEMILLKEDLAEERSLKYGAISKAQFAVEKGTKFARNL